MRVRSSFLNPKLAASQWLKSNTKIAYVITQDINGIEKYFLAFPPMDPDCFVIRVSIELFRAWTRCVLRQKLGFVYSLKTSIWVTTLMQ